MSGGERGLAAIMFTDIVGFTKLAQANERASLELLEEHRGLVRPILVKHGGTEVKTIGDAFLVEFRSALEAVLCGVEIQKAMVERNGSVTSGRRVELRVGIHLGDVVHGSGDIYGDAVNVASRIEPLAEPNGICISQQVYDNVRNKTDLDISRLGEIELKNVELPVGVYKIAMSQPSTEPRVVEAPAPRERLAVLPFVNISPDPNDEYFADGLTEELISKLSGIGGLKVIARTSVMNYKKKEKKASDIGRELYVGSIIEGSIRKAGNRIRVTVQLIDARTEEHLWASNYDNNLDDIFAIQSDVASKVAGSISSGVLIKREERDTADIEAYTDYIRGMQMFHEGGEASLREAIALFERAIARDPTYARAYAALSQAWGQLAVSGSESFDFGVGKAEQAALRAIELRPDLAESQATMSRVDSYFDRFPKAIAEAERAIKINPNLSEGHISLGIMYCSMNQVDKGTATFRKAYELDPLSFSAGSYLSIALRNSGRTDEAIRILERLVELNPRNSRNHIGLAECHMIAGDFEEAQRAIDRAVELNSAESLVPLDQGVLYALIGKRKEALECLSEIMKSPRESVRLYGNLFINTALGNIDEAFGTLSRMAETHSWPFLIGSSSIFSPLWGDPRYREFCAKVGIPPPP